MAWGVLSHHSTDSLEIDEMLSYLTHDKTSLTD